MVMLRIIQHLVEVYAYIAVKEILRVILWLCSSHGYVIYIASAVFFIFIASIGGMVS